MPEGFKAQREGQATILQKANEVFYNPAQVRRYSRAQPSASMQSACSALAPPLARRPDGAHSRWRGATPRRRPALKLMLQWSLHSCTILQVMSKLLLCVASLQVINRDLSIAVLKVIYLDEIS